MNEKAEDGVNRPFPDQAFQSSNRPRQMPWPGDAKSGDMDPGVAQLIRHRSPLFQARDFDDHVWRIVQASRNFTDDGRRAADFEVGDEQEDSAGHAAEIILT